MAPISVSWNYFANGGILYEYNYYPVGCKNQKMTLHINIILQCS